MQVHVIYIHLSPMYFLFENGGFFEDLSEDSSDWIGFNTMCLGLGLTAKKAVPPGVEVFYVVVSNMDFSENNGYLQIIHFK